MFVFFLRSYNYYIMKFNVNKFIDKFNLKIENRASALKNVDDATFVINVAEYETFIKFSSSSKNNFLLIIRDESVDETYLTDLFKKFKDFNISAVVISKVHDKTFFKKIAKENDITLLSTDLTSREIYITLERYILEKEIVPKRIHGTMMSVYGEGILIIGDSGMGKSELALELVSNGHFFIGDDAIDVKAIAGKVVGRAPKSTRPFIEVRGVGIINARDMFGIKSIVNHANIDLVLELVDLDKVRNTIDRLGAEIMQYPLVGINLPKIQIPVYKGRNLSSIVEAAVISQKQRKYDKYIAIDDLNQRIINSNKK